MLTFTLGALAAIFALLTFAFAFVVRRAPRSIWLIGMTLAILCGAVSLLSFSWFLKEVF